jgi:hypothetical protein
LRSPDEESLAQSCGRGRLEGPIGSNPISIDKVLTTKFDRHKVS